MELTDQELNTFRRYRARGYGATEAKTLALRWIAQGRDYWGLPDRAAYIGKANESGERWIDNPESAGLRFVGFADEIAGLRHTGWHTVPHGDGELMRGAVYQLPARKGRARYVPAYRIGNESRRNGRAIGWQDMAGPHGAFLALGDIREGERLESSYDDDSAKRDAAFTADSMAEHAAERAREYDDAWQAGQQFADLMESAQQARSQARELIGDIRRARGDSGFCERFPSIGAALRSAIRDSLESWQAERKEACELWDEYSLTRRSAEHDARARELAGAFAEGANL